MYVEVTNEYRLGIEKIVTVEDNAIEAIINALETSPSTFRFIARAAEVAAKTGNINELDAQQIIISIASLNECEDENASTEDIVTVITKILNKDKNFPSFNDEELSRFRRRLTDLLNSIHRVNPASRFYDLASKWKKETGHVSLISDMVLHPAYQQIIGMGADVVPLILKELQKEPDHWFWALRAITGANPVKEEDRGRLKKMAEVWLAWGRQRGYKC